MEMHYAWLPLLAENNIAYVFLIAAILVATLTLLLRLYRYQTRQKRAVPVRPPAQPDSRGLRATAPESIVRWEVQMQELARDLKAEIDSKMVALGHLIRDADRAAGRLEKALASAPSAAGETFTTEDRADSEPPSKENAGLRDEVYTLADYGFSVADIASRLQTPTGQIELILRLRESEE